MYEIPDHFREVRSYNKIFFFPHRVPDRERLYTFTNSMWRGSGSLFYNIPLHLHVDKPLRHLAGLLNLSGRQTFVTGELCRLPK